MGLRLAFVLLGIWCASAQAQQAPSARTTHAAKGDQRERNIARQLGQDGLLALEQRQFALAESRLSQAIEYYSAPTLRLARARSRM